LGTRRKSGGQRNQRFVYWVVAAGSNNGVRTSGRPWQQVRERQCHSIDPKRKRFIQ
jgi:hypothetical protein